VSALQSMGRFGKENQVVADRRRPPVAVGEHLGLEHNCVPLARGKQLQQEVCRGIKPPPP